MNKTTTQIGALLSRGLRRVKAKLRSALIWCRERKAEHETTEALRSLDDRLLRDIGIDRYWNSEQVHTRMTPVRDTAPVVEIKSGQPEIQHYTLADERNCCPQTPKTATWLRAHCVEST